MSKVQLYVYDLSGGLARALSLQHGQPLQIIDFGETAIDEDTFNEYLTEIREHYTADKYHLLGGLVLGLEVWCVTKFVDFNCNSFTNDVIGFLTGQHIPSWIRDLPADFLSTPFGASLRPTIDNMFRRPTPGTTPPIAQTPTQAAPSGDISDLLLQAVAQRAASGSGAPSNGPAVGAPAASTVAAPIHISTNSASLTSLLNTHKTAVVFFTSANCGPCRMVEPAFEDYAREKSGPDVAFVKVSLDGMGGQAVGAQYGVRVTPTFLFFLNGEKTDELKGPDRHELKTKVDLLLYRAFPPHPHMSINVPSLKKLPTQPIVYEQVPDLSKLLAKLQSTIKSHNLAGFDSSVAVIADVIRTKGKQPATDQNFHAFEKASDAILVTVSAQDLFPLLDLWRLALLVEGFATRCTVNASGLINVFKTVAGHLQKMGPSAPKALALTSLRLQSNVSANSALLRQLLQERDNRSNFTQILVSGLLHEDTGVRTAAATLVFNVGTHLQRSRRQAPTRPDPVEDGDWEVEVLTAVLEGLSTESDPGAVHRLISAFGFIVLLSPWFSEQTSPLLEVLDAKRNLEMVAASSKEAEVKKLAKDDQSLSLFGLADQTTVDFVIASGKLFPPRLNFASLNDSHSTVASRAKSTEALHAVLSLPDTPDAHRFVAEVYARAPRKSKSKHAAVDSRRDAEKKIEEMRNKNFGFLLEDDVPPAPSGKSRSKRKEAEPIKAESKSHGKKERHTRKRDADGRDWESDEEEKERKRRREWEESEHDAPERSFTGDEDGDEEFVDEETRKETERLKDAKERDEFAKRVRDRDKDRTKKVVEDKSSRNAGALAEAAQRRALADDAAARVAAMPSLRERSRQEYLTKRELQQIELLRKEIADDEAL
ncbi:hypothetical protein FRC07_005783, partial [Ceratobasidium sp. 392]